MAPTSTAPPPADPDDSPAGLAAKIDALLREDYVRNAGQLMLLGLDDVRATLGEEVWARISRLVPVAVEQQLGKVLKNGDRVVQVSSDCFLTIINSSDHEGAVAMMRQACDVLAQHLVGAKGMGQIKFRAIVSEMDAPDGQRRSARVGADAEDAPGGLADAGSAAPGLADIQLPKIKERRAEDRQAVIAGLTDDLSFLPSWDAQNKVLSTFTAGSWEVLRTGWISDRAWRNARLNEAECAFADTGVLRNCLNMMGDLYENNFALLLIVPVHYPTLATKAGRTLLAETVRRIPKYLKRLVSLELFDVPEDTDIRVLGDRLAPLRPFVGSVVIYLESWNARTARLLACPLIHGAGLALPMEAAAADRMMAELPDYVATSMRNRVTPGLVHVTTRREIDQGLEAGVVHFVGPAVSKPVPLPLNMVRCSVNELPYEF